MKYITIHVLHAHTFISIEHNHKIDAFLVCGVCVQSQRLWTTLASSLVRPTVCTWCFMWIRMTISTPCHRRLGFGYSKNLVLMSTSVDISQIYSSARCCVMASLGCFGGFLASEQLTSLPELPPLMSRCLPFWLFVRYQSNCAIYTVSQKTVQNCFCQNFVKLPPILIIFGRRIEKRLQLCVMHSFSTSPNSRHYPTVLNQMFQTVTQRWKLLSIINFLTT